MSVTYTKLFSSITESTVWCEPDRIRLVWITMLAMADKHGRVWAAIPGLANRARVPVKDARDAIKRFLAPDADSRTSNHEGRRIEAIDGGWRLLNHEKYRNIRDEENRREYLKVKKRESRQRLSTMSTKVNLNQHNADADAKEQVPTAAFAAEGELRSASDDQQPPCPRPELVKTRPLSDGDVERIRLSYVRKVGQESARKSIRAQHALLMRGQRTKTTGGTLPKMTSEQATAYMADQAGLHGQHPDTVATLQRDESKVPYPATWFTSGDYTLDWSPASARSPRPGATSPQIIYSD